MSEDVVLDISITRKLSYILSKYQIKDDGIYDELVELFKEAIKDEQKTTKDIRQDLVRTYNEIVKGGPQKKHFSEQKEKFRKIFDKLSEDIKQGKKTRFFIDAVNADKSLPIVSHKKLEEYYRDFVKEYKNNIPTLKGGEEIK